MERKEYAKRKSVDNEEKRKEKKIEKKGQRMERKEYARR